MKFIKLALIFILATQLSSGWLDRNFSCKSKENIKFNENWKEFLGESEDAIETFNDLINYEESWFSFINSKEDLQDDFNEILEDMIATFTDNKKVIFCLNKMKKFNREILDIQNDILLLKEKNIDNSTKIAKEMDEKYKEISKLQNYILEIKKSILNELKKLGLEISDEELNTLLVRIDSQNIIQMMLVFDISKKITSKLEKLMLAGNGDIKITKRYYGMNLILSEIALFIQNKYITSIDSKFIPKLKKMISEISQLKKHTVKLLNQSHTDYEKNIYKNNIESQQLTLKTAEIYIKNLNTQKNQIKLARKQVLRNLDLTLNSYQTMAISSNLLNLINLSKKSFSKIMKMQFPEIIPFKNPNMAKEYQKLTEELNR